ncbi:aldehyde ferredoxin oxidoreductase N-terminal domain-containing protein [Pyrofollis japonicus]|uniref:aldehyde ferredoxin oxidoreductase N-terminal domain-containing protein n=1 Tax=Pyrofollis japonicus TaxID=3060460 RepID=UPI00295C1D46|nr:aldehyde ferredoxin oxidoreductase N-terminal domain-containing protein [Pyrofollis japonicus]BEP18137.1 aldehyde ferredoxin oxidoreductase N-terminal domain-containing protein [Pyrofollis japonicus]
MSVFRVLVVDAASRNYRVEEQNIGSGILGIIDYGVRLHVDKYKSYEVSVDSPRNVVVAGCGPFAGARVFGGHRMVFVFRSPETMGLHVSTLGGACYQFMRTGLRGLVVEGWSEEPVIIKVLGKRDGRIDVDFIGVSWEKLWNIWGGFEGYRGTSALALYLYREVVGGAEFPVRVAVVGPAAARTMFGGIFSYMVEGEWLSPVVDSASRAGGGSVLLRAHGVAGIVFGGDYDFTREAPTINKMIEDVTREVFGKPYAVVARSVTTKYRFDEKLGTGGTFGVNYVHYRDMLPFFGYNTVYLSKAARLRILDIILEHLWKLVQREVFEAPEKPWRTCGEPCIAACKKIWRGVKIDYEPSNALGGLVGVVKADQVADLIRLADDLGIDAIEAGHIISWIFDAVHRGMLLPEEVGLGQRPFFDPLSYTVDQSDVNYELAKQVLEGLVEHRSEILKLVAEKGLRKASLELNKRFESRTRMYGLGFHDLIVCAPYGDEAYMTPNLYWAPGLIAPIPVPGRYWSYYSPAIPRDPREFAEVIINRMVNEYLVDNAGTCRFYRKWTEKVLEKLYEGLVGEKIDLVSHARRVLGSIARYRVLAGAVPRPWDSKKSIDMIVSLAAELGDKELAEQLYRAHREYWEKLYKHIWSWLGVIPEEAEEASAPTA